MESLTAERSEDQAIQHVLDELELMDEQDVLNVGLLDVETNSSMDTLEITQTNSQMSDVKAESLDLKLKMEVGIMKEETKDIVFGKLRSSVLKTEKDEKLGVLYKVEPKKEKKRGRKKKGAVVEEDRRGHFYWDEGLDSENDDDLPKPRRRGRCKKLPESIPPHLTQDLVLGYKILSKLLETPQFLQFHRASAAAESMDKIVCFNQIKKKFEDNGYRRIADFVNDVREMLTNIYESRNTVATKRALRLEQVLEQRIAQLPNYLRPQCSLILSSEDVNNSPNKIRINKGGGFVSLLLEKAERARAEKDKEKRKILAEERKMLKEEQDKDVLEWEKNVLMKGSEAEVRNMWELAGIGHFIILCMDILNIGPVTQYEVERMLLMVQCSHSLDLIMTALLSNSLVRAKLDRTPSMPYSVWGPLLRTRVSAWYRAYQREGRNAQKVFEEVGVEPEFWYMVGGEVSPLETHQLHELPFVQRVWLIKSLCDVDFVRKKTVHDNMRAQTLDELNGVNLGLDRHGNRYIHMKQFCGPDLRIYRQKTALDGLDVSETVEGSVGFETRQGIITWDKVLGDVWETKQSAAIPVRNKQSGKKKRKVRRGPSKAIVEKEETPRRNLRTSARAKKKIYTDWTDSDQSDTDLATLKLKLRGEHSLHRPISDKEFISLSVFRLPRDKPGLKPTSRKSAYMLRKEMLGRNNQGGDEEDGLDLKQMQDMQVDFEKTLHMEDEAHEDKVSDNPNFCVKTLGDLKMVLKKGTANSLNNDSKTNIHCKDGNEAVSSLYLTPPHLLPSEDKFTLIADTPDSLRQLISNLASDETDLQLIHIANHSNKKKKGESSDSCEVQLLVTLQNLLTELEPWEVDLIKSARSSRQKMYKEYKDWEKRSSDFVHPNEAYWLKLYEEPPPLENTTQTTQPTQSEVVAEKIEHENKNKPEVLTVAEELGLRKRLRTSRAVTQPALPESDNEEEQGQGDQSTAESDDSWEMPGKRRHYTAKTTQNSVSHDTRSASKETPSEKTPKKALCWGQRSSNPSEELDWETNRQKILQKHNSPTKTGKAGKAGRAGRTVVSENEGLMDEMAELESALTSTARAFQQHSNSNNVKKLNHVVPGNKKPYYSSAQLKALDKKDDEVQVVTQKLFKHMGTQSNAEVIDISEEAWNKPPNTPPNTPPQPRRGQIRVRGPAPRPPPPLSASRGPVAQPPRMPRPLNQTRPVSLGPVQTVITQKTAVISQVAQFRAMNVGNVGAVRMQTPGTAVCNTVRAMGQGPTPVRVQGHLVSPVRGQGQIVSPVHAQGQITTPIRVQGPIITHVASLGQGRLQSPQKVVGVPRYPFLAQTQTQKFVQATRMQQTAQRASVPQYGQQRQPGPSAIRLQGRGQTPQILFQSPQIITSNPQIITSNPQIITSNPQIITSNPQIITSNPQILTSNQQIMTSNQQIITQNPQIITQNPQIITQNPQIITQNPQIITQNPQIITQNPQMISQSPEKPKPNDLYLTDGNLLIKADANFVQQFLQKDKVLTLNLNDKLDLKKPLYIVKPKLDNEPSTSTQQNILFVNKPVQNVQNIIIPEQNVLMPQQPVVIQQKPVLTKQPTQLPTNQVIKILNQPQNLILAPFATQESPKTNLRFIRPQNLLANTKPAQITVQNPQNPPVRFLNANTVRFVRNASPQKVGLVSSTIGGSPGKLNMSGAPQQTVRLQTVSLPTSLCSVSSSSGTMYSTVQSAPVQTVQSMRSLQTIQTTPILIRLEDEEEEDVRVLERRTQAMATVDLLNGQLSVKETSQGWRYVVKASDGSDVLLSHEQVEARRAAHRGVMQ